MKLLISLIAMLGVLACPATVLAAKGGKKGPDDHAFDNANENASFKRGKKDWDNKLDIDDRDIDDKDLKKLDKKLDKENKHHGKNKDDLKDALDDADIDEKDLNKAAKKAKKYVK
jgi:hypothetical protein